MAHQEIYDTEFFQTLRDGSLTSARRIVPEILRLVRARSVVDVGCGVGTWLRVFQECGIQDFLGVDGDYVNRRLLEFPGERFLAHDLNRSLKLDRRFDLVVSLEVAEHLPPESAETFVRTLTSLGPVVMFSAAIPFQNGNNHLNEQWPDYWAEQFRRRGYATVDCIRRLVWSDDEVEPWYAQNTLVFVDESKLADYPLLAQARASMAGGFLSMVHPKTYLLARHEAELSVTFSKRLDNIPLKRILTALPTRVVQTFSHRLRGKKNGHQSPTLRPADA